MPIPKPLTNENKDKFINRCLSDLVMQKEYPDVIQRMAVCFNSYEKGGKK